MAELHNNNIVNENKGWKYKWQPWEDEIIKHYYSKNGYEEVLKHLPHRNKKGIQSRAHKLGVRYLIYNMDYFEIVDTPTKAYWLGFLYADGYVTTSDRWGLELSEVDKTHMENLLFDMVCNINLKHRERKNGTKSYSFQIKNSKMHKDLINLGVVMNKTESLLFPNRRILPTEYISHFVRGFFDGDGCITFSINPFTRKDRNNRTYTTLRKDVTFVCKSYDFIIALQSILNVNGIDLKLYTNVQKNNLHTLALQNKEGILKFYDYIYQNSSSNNRLNRKYAKFQELFCHF